jgi:hypothetical protein
VYEQSMTPAATTGRPSAHPLLVSHNKCLIHRCCQALLTATAATATNNASCTAAATSHTASTGLQLLQNSRLSNKPDNISMYQHWTAAAAQQQALQPSPTI